MTADDIQIGKTYRAKRFRKSIFGFNNDRRILWISENRTMIQYDSDTVADGRLFPIISMEQFLKWVKCEVIAES
jgi:hypothetical protein